MQKITLLTKHIKLHYSKLTTVGAGHWLACLKFLAEMCGTLCDQTKSCNFLGMPQKTKRCKGHWSLKADSVSVKLETTPRSALVLFPPPTEVNKRCVGQAANIPSGHPGAKAYLSSGNTWSKQFHARLRQRFVLQLTVTFLRGEPPVMAKSQRGEMISH